MNQKRRSWVTISVFALLLAATIWMLMAVWSQDNNLPWNRSDTMVSHPVEARDNDIEAKDHDDHSSDEPQSRIRFVDGHVVIKLTLEEQRMAGIETELLGSSAHRSEIKAYGEALDVQPLLEFRTKYDAARSEQEIYAAELQASLHEYQRLHKLGKQGKIISPQELKVSESNWRRDKARLESANIKRRNVRDQAVQIWGNALVSMALSGKSKQFDRLIDHQDALVLVTLLPGQILADGTRVVFINRNTDRKQARKAHLISAATHTDKVTQGETYLFVANGEHLRSGMRLIVWIPQSKTVQMGVRLPAESIIWYAGKPWAYVKLSEELFARRSVPRESELDDAWFVRDGFTTDEHIVVSGAQLLLSEEFRWQIPEEDTD